MPRGFSLVEVVVALAIVSTATMAIAHLSIVAVRANRTARSTTVATMLAVQKMEQLQSAGWDELTPSPFEALGRNTDGYCDFLDGSGRTLATGTSTPMGAVFVRRWAIDPLSADALLIQISVIPVRSAGIPVVGPRRPEEARIVSIKARR